VVTTPRFSKDFAHAEAVDPFDSLGREPSIDVVPQQNGSITTSGMRSGRWCRPRPQASAQNDLRGHAPRRPRFAQGVTPATIRVPRSRLRPYESSRPEPVRPKRAPSSRVAPAQPRAFTQEPLLRLLDSFFPGRSPGKTGSSSKVLCRSPAEHRDILEFRVRTCDIVEMIGRPKGQTCFVRPCSVPPSGDPLRHGRGPPPSSPRVRPPSPR
jgi:hypothetical protein